MKIFQAFQKNFAIVGINPDVAQQRFPFNVKILLGVLLLGSAIICNLSFVIYEAKTFAEYTQTVYNCSVSILVLSAMVITILKMKKMFESSMIATVWLIQLKYSPSQLIFHETNELNEKLSEIIFFVMVKVTSAGAIIPWSTYFYFMYFTTDLAFELPCPMRLPFDWRTPFGYLIAIVLQYEMLSHALMIGGSVVSLAFSCYLFAIAMSKCIKGSLFTIAQSTDNKTQRAHILEQIFEFIEFHSRVKKFINGCSDVLQHFANITFIWSLCTICGALLMIQMQISNYKGNLLLLVITIIEVFYAFTVLLMVCELGERTGLAFDECSDIIDQFKWYLFSAKIQQMLPIIMNFSHQPIQIKCFGSISADRDTFKYVIKTAFSYYTVLRQFYN